MPRRLLAFLGVLLAAPAVLAQPGPPATTPPAPDTTLPEVVVTAPTITNPDWLRRPAGEDLARVYPSAAINQERSGQVRMQCQVSSNGYLTRCRITSEEPVGEGFGNAALSMQSMFQMRPQLVNGQPVTGASVTIPINFSMGRDRASRLEPRDRPPTRTRDRALNRSAQAVVYRPAWAAAPTREQVMAAAPPAPGTATVRCRIGEGGALSNCQTVMDYPEGQGLGDIAERLATQFRVIVPAGFNAGTATDVDIPFDLRRDPPEYLLRPSWRATPTGEQLQAALEPIAAAATNRTARAMLDCRIGDGGALTDCRANEATPEAAGPALIGLAGAFTAAPWTDDGYAAVGARVRVPLRYVAD